MKKPAFKKAGFFILCSLICLKIIAHIITNT
jgi:hypothetical protein